MRERERKRARARCNLAPQLIRAVLGKKLWRAHNHSLAAFYLTFIYAHAFYTGGRKATLATYQLHDTHLSLEHHFGRGHDARFFRSLSELLTVWMLEIFLLSGQERSCFKWIG